MVKTITCLLSKPLIGTVLEEAFLCTSPERSRIATHPTFPSPILQVLHELLGLLCNLAAVSVSARRAIASDGQPIVGGGKGTVNKVRIDALLSSHVGTSASVHGSIPFRGSGLLRKLKFELGVLSGCHRSAGHGSRALLSRSVY
jgi:hypothetical protein